MNEGNGIDRERRRAAVCSLLLLCGLLAAGEVLGIGIAKKPKPQEQPAPEAAATGVQGPAATGGSRGNRAPAREELTDAEERVREQLVAEERKHLRRLAWADRIQALGIGNERPKLIDIARKLRRAEEQRHELARARLERELEAAQARGGGS